MKLRLMDILVCPQCKNSFQLKAHATERREYSSEWFERVAQMWEARGTGGREVKDIWESYCTDVITGELSCSTCQRTYPIERGVARILPAELRTQAGMGRGNPKTDERLSRFMDDIEPVSADADQTRFNEIQLANQSNYGFEWQAFAHEYEGWEDVYNSYYCTEKPEFFQGKLGLDAGCGMGRYTLVAVKRGAEMVGLDLSNAIEMSYKKSCEIPTFLPVQGDIFNPPFRPDTFEFAQSLGVIHITPDPEAALLSIKRAVQPKGKIFIMVYTNFEGYNALKYWLLKPTTAMRRMTVKMSSSTLYNFLYLMMPVAIGTGYLPSMVLWKLGAKKLSSKLHYNYEQYGKRRFRDIHMNLFDRFGNPVERRYNKPQMDAWMKKAGFDQYQLEHRDGWIVTAVKPEGA